VSKNTKNAEAAWKVIDFLTGEAAQQQVLESGFALPTRTSLGKSEYFTNNPNSAAIFNGALEGARPFFWGSVGSDVNDQMGKALERIMKEDQAPADSMKAAAKAVRDALASQ
jgi:multiple sugar transport system substrate-binding protein